MMKEKTNLRIDQALFDTHEEVLEGYSDGLKEKTWMIIRREVIKGELSSEEIREALQATGRKFLEYDEFYTVDFLKYFQGVLRKMKENNEIW